MILSNTCGLSCVSYGVIFDATMQTCIFDSQNVDASRGRAREGSGRRLLAARSSNETIPNPAAASECDAAAVNETRQARQELADLMGEVATMKAAHSAEIAALKVELHRQIEQGQEESRRAQEELLQRSQTQTRELLVQLLAERNR
jgi:hypothetical protein